MVVFSAETQFSKPTMAALEFCQTFVDSMPGERPDWLFQAHHLLQHFYRAWISTSVVSTNVDIWIKLLYGGIL